MPWAGGEVGELELLAVALEAVAQHVERAARREGAEEVVEDGGLGLRAKEAFELGPRLGLRAAQEGEELAAVEGQVAIERLGVALEKAAMGEQALLDGGLERDLLVVGRHQTPCVSPTALRRASASRTARRARRRDRARRGNAAERRPPRRARRGRRATCVRTRSTA